MTEQATWVPLPRRRPRKIKIDDALERAGKLTDWYTQFKPSVKRVVVTKDDYQAFEDGVGNNGITRTDDGIKFRGFLVVIA